MWMCTFHLLAFLPVAAGKFSANNTVTPELLHLWHTLLPEPVLFCCVSAFVAQKISTKGALLLHLSRILSVAGRRADCVSQK